MQPTFAFLVAALLSASATEAIGQQLSAVLQFSSASYIPEENGGPATIHVVRTGNTNTAATVEYTTGKGTATPDADYKPTSGTLSFAPGETNATFSVPILDDPFAEGSESVELTLSNPSDGAVLGSPATARLLIYDNEHRGSLLDPTFTSPIRPKDIVTAIKVEEGGKILVCGNFGSSGLTAPGRVIRVMPDGSRDATFETTDVVPNDTVRVIALQSDGKILLGGQFTKVGNLSRNRIARLNADGTVDMSFDPSSGVEGSVTPGVYAIAVQPDGKVLIGGNFESVGGVTRTTIARLQPDGLLDRTFNPVGGVNSTDPAFRVPWISAIAVQIDGKVLISGQFTDVDGLSRVNIARLNSDGSADASFDPGSGAVGDRATVEAMALQPDGKIVIAGDFTKVNDVDRSGIARLNSDGSIDTTFDPGPGIKSTDAEGAETVGLVTSLAVQSDGKVLLSGAFSIVDDINRRGVARVNPDGSLDPTFGPYWGTTYRNELGYEELESVSALALQADDKVLIGGTFVSANGSRTNRLTRLLSSNIRASSFEFLNPRVSVGESTGPLTVTVIRRGDSSEAFRVQYATSGGRATADVDYEAQSGTLRFDRLETEKTITIPIYDDAVVEDDETFNVILRNPSAGATLGAPANVVIDIIDSKRPGNLDFSFANLTIPFQPNPTAFPPVMAILVQNDTKLLVAGHFTTVSGTNRNGLVRLKSNGSIDSDFVPEIPPGALALDFHQMGLQPDGRIVGGFDGANRINTDGSVDTQFSPNVGDVNALVVLPDGRFLVADEFFDPFAGINRNQLSRFLGNGTLDMNFMPAELNDWVNAIVPQRDGKAVVGGYFTMVNGIIQNRIARLNTDGSLDQTFDIDGGINGPRAVVYVMALQSDGKIIVGGDFNRAANANRNHIARLNANGSVDLNFDPGSGPNNFVESIAVQPDGKILIGGGFTHVNGVRRLGLARLNKDGSLDTNFEALLTFPGVISMPSIALQGDGKILIGGLFTGVNGVVRTGLARLNGDASFVKLDPAPPKPTGLFRLSFTTRPGKQYRIEASADLVNWFPISTNIANGFTLEFEDPEAKGPFGRFYRAVLIGP
ncbi:MAG: hypothetical protein HY735_18435 [Verrucomicrobia bacterium]|nr:hypothetical protein [Verrucomicrobiota bacterium]